MLYNTGNEIKKVLIALGLFILIAGLLLGGAIGIVVFLLTNL